MTNSVNNLKKATAAINASTRGAGYKKGTAVFDLRSAFSKRQLDLPGKEDVR